MAAPSRTPPRSTSPSADSNYSDAFASTPVYSSISPQMLPQHYPGGHATTLRLSGLGNTPVKHNSASVRSRGLETHASVDPHLKQELHDQISYEVPEYLDRLLLPSDPDRRAAVAAVIDAAVEAMAPLRGPDGWKDCHHYKEQQFLPEFAGLWHSIAEIAAAVRLPAAPCLPLPDRRYVANGTRYLKGSTTRRKLDFFVAAALVDGGDILAWERVLLFAEMKDMKNPIAPSDVALQLGGYAREVFYAQPHRRFVHALFVLKSEVMLFRFDRSGALASPRFDMHKDWETFVRTVLAYTFMDPLDLGFDPSFQLASPSVLDRNVTMAHGSEGDSNRDAEVAPVTVIAETAPSASNNPTPPHSPDGATLSMPLAEPPQADTFTLQVGPDVYRLGPVLDSRKVVTGRATTCWAAMRLSSSGEDSRYSYVIKDSWRQMGQRGEGHIYKRAQKCGVDGLLDMVCDAYAIDPSHPTRPDTVLESVRRGCVGLRIPNKRKRRKTDDPRGEPPPKKASIRKPESHENLAARQFSYQTADAAAIAVKPADDADRPDVVDRVRVRIVFQNAVGIPLSEVPSARTLFAIIRDALRCHRDLYKNAKILHRDVSVYNILGTTENMRLTGGVRRAGVLFDFDYALLTFLLSSGAVHRTGTLPFLAVSVLKGRNNTYRADLESFFYVICYACVMYNGGKPLPQKQGVPKNAKNRDCRGVAPGERPLGDWEGDNTLQIANSKMGTLTDPLIFEQLVLDHFTPMFNREPVRQLVDTLREHLIDSKWFTMNKLSKRIAMDEAVMMEKQKEWEAEKQAVWDTELKRRLKEGNPELPPPWQRTPGENYDEDEEGAENDSPAAKLQLRLTEEEDVDADNLYENMMRELQAALAGDDL